MEVKLLILCHVIGLRLHSPRERFVGGLCFEYMHTVLSLNKPNHILALLCTGYLIYSVGLFVLKLLVFYAKLWRVTISVVSSVHI